MQHTQIPWEWVNGECDEIESVQMLKGATGWILYHHAAWPVSDDDKRFIVNACNSYEELSDFIRSIGDSKSADEMQDFVVNNWDKIEGLLS